MRAREPLWMWPISSSVPSTRRARWTSGSSSIV